MESAPEVACWLFSPRLWSRRSCGQDRPPAAPAAPRAAELVGDALKMAAGPWAPRSPAATAGDTALRQALLEANIFAFEKKGKKKKIEKGGELFCNKCRSSLRSCNFLPHQDGANHTRSLQSAGMLKGSSVPRSWVLLAEWQLSLFNEA